MEVVFAVRGAKHFLDEFIKQLEGQYVAFKCKQNEKGQLDDNGKEVVVPVQLGVKPYMIYGVSFPKEAKDIVLSTIFKDGITHKKEYGKFDKFIMLVRKVLGLKPIGEWNKERNLPAALVNEHLDFIGIGIKEDKEYGWGEGL